MSRIRILLSLLLVLGTTMLATAAQADSDPIPAHPLPEARSRLPALPVEATPLAQPAQEVALDQIMPLSKVVFQSYREDRWDIYMANDDGSEEHQLTDHSRWDIHPNVDRGVNRLLYSYRHGDYDIRLLALNTSVETFLTQTDTDEVYPVWSPDGTRIAFQSYRDGQPEVYVMNADGSGVTRLTNHPEYDGYPAWSPDGSRIAFVSRRTGGYRIWVMNANGSNPIQLSNQPFSLYPAWSPDGSEIAFSAASSYNNWLDLWVMDADGSNQSSIYDPGTNRDAWARGWSPDGRYITFTEISFISHQGNWYWTQAFAKAKDTQQHHSTFRLSNDDRAWNPQWQTLDAQPPVSSISPLPTLSPGPFTINWSASDAGGTGTNACDVQVKESASGTWTDWLIKSPATSASYPGIGGTTYYFRSRCRDRVFNWGSWPTSPDATTTVEGSPPLTTLTPIPAYSRFDYPLAIAWQAVDPGGSGVASYDLQTRLNTGSWEPWLTGTINTNQSLDPADLNAVAGDTIALRARATDNAQNVAGWPSAAASTTTLYAWKASGTARDNIGTPIYDAIPDLSGGTFASDSDPLNGTYEAFSLSSTTPHLLAWDVPGYHPLPSTTISSANDSRMDVILPPQQNLVADWGFESGNLAESWTASGNLAAQITDTSPHTGQFAALLGTANNVITTQMTSGYRGIRPELDIDSQGRVHMVWDDYHGSIFYAERNLAGSWSSPVALGTSLQGYSSVPQIVVGTDDSVHAIWTTKNTSQGDHIFYSQRTPGGGWSTPERISGPGRLVGYYPRLVRDSQNRLHAFWQDEPSNCRDIYYAQRGNNGTWTPAQNVSGTCAVSGFEHYVMLDYRDTLHLAWTNRSSDPSTHDLVYVQRTANGNWSAIENMSAETGRYGYPSIAVDHDGIVHAVWFDFDAGPLYAIRSGGWSEPTSLSTEEFAFPILVGDSTGRLHLFLNVNGTATHSERLPNGQWQAPQQLDFPWSGGVGHALVDNHDNLHVLLNETDSKPGLQTRIHYGRWSVGGSWTPWRRLTAEFAVNLFYAIAVGQSGTASVAWQSGEDYYNADIFYAGFRPANESGSASLSQRVTIPATMTQPVLSILYQLEGATGQGDSALTISVDDGSGPTEVGRLNDSTAQWEHSWIDLSGWLSQTITLTLQLEQAANQPLLYAYVDEATVGSAYPDIWIAARSTSALPGETAVFPIYYGNRSAITAPAGRLTVTLPVSLTFASASIPPSLTAPLVWELGDLSATSSAELTITTTVANDAPDFTTLIATAEIATLQELETHNNVAEIHTFIGRQAYLPVAYRPQ